MRHRLSILALCATVLGLAAGCPKGDDDDDATGPATVTVYDFGSPVNAAHVLVSDGAGNVVTYVQTDANGQASVDVTSGGMITAAYTNSFPSRYVYTIAGVAPGDDLTFGYAPSTFTQVGTAVVTLPGNMGGATDYEVNIGCDSDSGVDGTTPYSLIISNVCGGQIDVLGVAYDSGGNAVGVTYQENVAVVTGGGDTTVTLPAWNATIPQVSIDLTNAPAGSGAVAALAASVSGNLSYEITSTVAGQPIAEGGSANFTVDVAPFGDALLTAAYLIYGSLGAPDSYAIHGRVDGTSPSSVSFDLAATFPPRHYGLNVDQGDPDRPLISWMSDGSFPGADYEDIYFSFFDGADDMQWEVIAPPTGQTFKLPALPTEMAEYLPSVRVYDTADVSIFGVSTISSYSQVRATGGLDDLGELSDGLEITALYVGGF